MQLVQSLKQFVRDEEGVTAIEYGLIAALVAVFIIGALQVLGTSLVDIFTAVSDALDAAH